MKANNSKILKKKLKLSDFTDVIVTGGSSGIGYAFLNTIHTINPQAKIFNLSRTFLAKKLPDAVFTHISCDLTQSKEINSAVQQLNETLHNSPNPGPILLINNSGFGSYGAFSDSDFERQSEMIQLNSVAPVLLTAQLMPLLLKRGGAILNIASTAAFQPTPWMITYGATKSFLLHWSLGLSEELRGRGIQVTAVCPGPTATQFFKNAGFDNSPLPSNVGQTADQVVAESLRALELRKSLVVTGLSNRFLTFFAGKFPKVFVTRLAGIILKKIRSKP